MEPLIFTLPFPPSVNQYWRNAGRTLLSDKARKFHKLAIGMIRRQLVERYAGHETIRHPVRVELFLFQPDRRRRDLDNMAKAVLDCITKSGLWTDDSLVCSLGLRWIGYEAGGSCKVLIQGLY